MRAVIRRSAWLTLLTAAIASAALAASIAPATGSATGSASTRLRHQVSSAFRGSTAHTVHYRVRIPGGPTLSRRPTSRSRPASNEKVLTTQTLLAQVGPNFAYRTSFYVTRPIGVHGVEPGDLVVHAGGDPTLTSSELGLLAKDLHRKLGLRRVAGDLVIDDSRYDHATRASGWKAGFLPHQSGPIDAFSVDSDSRGSSASYLADPTLANAAILRKALHHAKVTVSGHDVAGRLRNGAQLVLIHRSGKLSKIVRETLTVSDNYNAEMMLREAGYQHSGTGTRTSGVAAVEAEAARLHVRLGHVVDGSGLSYDDEESPITMLRWLRAIRRTSTADLVYDSMPTSCRTGTLEFRLCGTHVAGRVHAKTGTLDHVVALSGWTHTRSGVLVTFSFLLSGVRSLNAAQQHLDAAVSRLARYQF
jgi:D-alanyl-D-alanine carboxypeptidase/D-alanyl-D-alanine-endopeptidase (penicillin-binding protein 4)